MNISKLKDLEKGQDIFIMGGAPSIMNVDLSFLANEIVIGMNGTIILEKHFSSKYYAVSDLRFIQNKEKFDNVRKIFGQKTIVFRRDISKFLSKEDQRKIYTTRAIGRDGFSLNLARGFFHASTTTMLAIQLASYLGAKRIFLLGVDLNYSGNKARSYDLNNSEIPDAFLSYQIKNIVNAAKVLEQYSIQLINLSENSFLKPYLDFKKISQIKEP